MGRVSAKKVAAPARPKRGWSTNQLSRNVFEVRVPLRKARDWEWWAHLSSDHHWDSTKCKRDLLRSHLDQVVARNAVAIFTGDQYDLMQGKYDKRSSKSELRPELCRGDYLDQVIEQSVDWYLPYADHIAVVGEGNHETAIRTRYETDMIQRFVGLLNAKSGSKVFSAGYSGWVRFAFTETRSNRDNPVIQSVIYHFDHGWGGGGQVTHDAIQHQRRMTYLPDADIVSSGHSHDFWSKEVARLRLTKGGKVEIGSQLHLKIPSFKCDYGDGHGGWCIEKGHAPKIQGSWFIRFFWCGRRGSIAYEAIPTK